MVSALPDSVFGEPDAGNTAWMLASASMVLLMTPALAFFYGGLSRGKAVLNMMMMSFGSVATVSIVYVLWGFSESFGNTVTGDSDIWGVFSNPFSLFGSDQLMNTAGTEDKPTYVLWTGVDTHLPAIVFLAFQLTFAVITVALISGAVAERVKFSTWLVFSVLWSTIVYFPLSHMVWGGGLMSNAEKGFASWMFGTNSDGTANVAPIDFAGGTVVHINAGMAGLVLALIVGTRVGFGKTAYRPHNIPFVMLGAALLWFGWFGFNGGSAFGANGDAGLAWLNTTVATCAAMLGWLLVERCRDGHATTLGGASGIVAGLIGNSAGIPVTGINVRRPRAEQEGNVHKLAVAAAELAGSSVAVPREAIECRDEWVGPGYSLPTEEMVEAVRLFASLEGELLDPVYTGKAAAGLIGLVRSGEIGADERVLFVHTGGSPALYAYQPVLTGAVPL